MRQDSPICIVITTHRSRLLALYFPLNRLRSQISIDNVGGKHLEAAIDNMNTFGRIVLCGATSQYSSISVADDNDKLPQYQGLSNLHLAISNRIRIQGFLYSDHYDILDEFQTSMSKWIKEDRIKWRETVYEGLENAPKAFIGLFKGENFGRTLVKIGSNKAS